MTISPGNERGRHDTANGWRRIAWLVTAGIALAALTTLAFIGYQQPELLLDYVNLRSCG